MSSEFSLRLSQSLQPTPWLVQSGKILQMTADELISYLQTLSIENPLIDPESIPSPLEIPDIANHTVPRASRFSSPIEHDVSDADIPDRSESPSLLSFVKYEIDTAYTGREREVVLYLAGYLDESGYLTPDFQVICRESSYPVGELRHALHLLQQLEPAGIGASNVVECLLLQLPENALLERELVSNHLEDIAYGNPVLLAKKLNVSVQHLSQAIKAIRKLVPKPGARFSGQETIQYIYPDYSVIEDELGRLSIQSLHTAIQLRAFPDYLEMLKSAKDPAVAGYLMQKFRQFCFIQNSLKKRAQMMQQLLELITERQQRFFRFGPSALQALRMKDAAVFLDVHESTISRAIKGKYLVCSYGTFPLKYFFVKSVHSDNLEISVPEAKLLLKAIISSEPPQKSYSDRILSEIMTERGIPLSRRTITKYRTELGIPDYTMRRKAAAGGAL